MKFSIIMPSYLGQYEGAATNREEKLIRAVESVRAQTYPEWELIVCADGCERTHQLMCDLYETDHRIQSILIPKQEKFSPAIRNTPIQYAAGDYVTYLDSDDLYGYDHLQVIQSNLEGKDWVFYNDWIPVDGKWVERSCSVHFTKCGTANITHKRGLDVKWSTSRYGHDDWTFIKELKNKYPNWKHTVTPYYYVCHLPGKFDV